MLPDSGPARYVAFSMIDGQPIAASHSVRKALEIAGDLASFGIGHHPQTEVLDCGGKAEFVRRSEMSLATARARFPTVRRAEGGDGLPTVPSPVDGGPP